MATIVAAASGGNWTATGTWIGGVVPTINDDVQLTASSGNVTINTGVLCRSLDCNDYTGTLSHAASATLKIGAATAGTGNIALRLGAGMTYTYSDASTSIIQFTSTAATVQTITTNGKVLGTWTVNGLGGSYILTDSNTSSSTGYVALDAGTLNTNGQSCSWGRFATSGTGVRTISLGSSAITITGSSAAIFIATISTNLTVTPNTATFTLTGTAANFRGGNVNWNGASLVYAGDGLGGTGGDSFGTFNNVTYTGSASRNCILYMGGPLIVTGTLTITGNSTLNRVLVYNLNAPGTPISVSAAAVSLSNVDFSDIAASGAAAPWSGTSLGDCLGNSNITFTAPTTQTWQGTSGGSWGDSAKWSSRVPLPQDDVVIASAFSTSQTVTINMPRIGKNINFTGTTGSPTIALGTSIIAYGSLTLASGIAPTISGGNIILSGRSNYTITGAGKTIGGDLSITAPTGTYTLQDALTITAVAGLKVLIGTFVTNNNLLTCGNLVTATGTSVNLGTSTVALAATATMTVLNMHTGCTLTAGAATITIANASPNTRTLIGGGKTYGTLNYTAAGSTGSLVINDGNTFGTLNFSDATNARTLTLGSSSQTTITSSFNVFGTAGKLITINAGTPGSAATLLKLSGIVNTNYLNLQDSTASGGARWYTGGNSTAVSNVSGWIFASANTGSFFELFD